MKHFLILSAILLQAFFVNAQQGQGQGRGKGQGQGGGGGQGQTITPFNIDNALGVINYDIYEVFEKLKIESDTEMQGVAKAISNYSSDVNKIKLANSKELNEVEKFVTDGQEDAMANGNRESMRYVMAEANQTLRPIKMLAVEAEENLNINMVDFLTDKQYKKWLKYQSSKKANLKPKQQSSMQGGGGQRGSGGNRSY